MTLAEGEYSEELQKARALLIVTSLQSRQDLRAVDAIKGFGSELTWEPLESLCIEHDVWSYIIQKDYDPKLVFCHPEILRMLPITSVHYRGLSGMSLKTARNYFGALEKLEDGTSTSLNSEKALRMARTYNLFISTILRNSTSWTLENGYRTVIATLGITLDGRMRNTIGTVAEKRIRDLIVEWLRERELTEDIPPAVDPKPRKRPLQFALRGDVEMRFGSEPDISFRRRGELLAVIEIKGGTDTAGALERYGAATKSFQKAMAENQRCKNFYLGAVLTPELERRIKQDRFVERPFDIIRLLDNPEYRMEFLRELFHHTLRMID
jgi:hypothetical protein